MYFVVHTITIYRILLRSLPIEELAYLLVVKISKQDQRKLLDRYKGKHKNYWRSRRLIQRSIFDWVNEPSSYELGFRLMLKK